MTSSKIKKINEFIAEKMTASNLSGLSLAIVEKGELTYSCGFGQRSEEAGLPATDETLYGIGSVTKSFTALAIMKLDEEGKLSLSDEVSKYLDFDIRPFGEPILIKHLLDHTSGIPALAYAESLIRNKMGMQTKKFPMSSCKDMLTFMQGAEDWVETKPGERWFYLNEGYVLLGAIIEKVSGLEYREYIQKYILKELGMNRTFFKKVDVEGDHDFAVPYIVTQTDSIPSNYLYGAITSDGGMISNVIDMANYIKMFLGIGRFNGKQILGQQHMKEMMKPRIHTPAIKYFSVDESKELDTAQFYNDKNSEFYGYGLSINPDFWGHKIVGHGGSVGIATANMSFIVEKGMGVMLLANGAGYALSRINQYIMALLTDNNPEHLLFVQLDNKLSRLEGIYKTFKDTFMVVVRRKGDFLQFEVGEKGGTSIATMIPESFSEKGAKFFRIEGGYKSSVDFCFKGESVEMIADRYKFRRIGPICNLSHR